MYSWTYFKNYLAQAVLRSHLMSFLALGDDPSLLILLGKTLTQLLLFLHRMPLPRTLTLVFQLSKAFFKQNYTCKISSLYAGHQKETKNNDLHITKYHFRQFCDYSTRQ